MCNKVFCRRKTVASLISELEGSGDCNAWIKCLWRVNQPISYSPSWLWLCLRETRSAPSVPLAGEQLAPSFFCCLFGNQKEQFLERKLIMYALIIAVCGGISPGAVQGEEKQAPASGSKPFGTFWKRQVKASSCLAGEGRLRKTLL